MAYEYNNAAAAADSAFSEQFYPYVHSPTASLDAATSPTATAAPVSLSPATALSAPLPIVQSAHQHQHQHQQNQTVVWTVPFEYPAGVASITGPSMSSPREPLLSSPPQSSPPIMSPAHNSSASSSPHQQLLSSFGPALNPPPSPALLTEWSLQKRQHQLQQQQEELCRQQEQLRQLQRQQQENQQQQRQQHHFIQDQAVMMGFNMFNYQPSTLMSAPPPPTPTAGLQLGPAFYGLPSNSNTVGSPVSAQALQQQYNLGQANWQDFDAVPHGLAQLPQQRRSITSLGSNSPTSTYLEVHSLGSSCGEAGWSTVDYFPPLSFPASASSQQAQAIFNPSQTLHLRTSSTDSVDSDANALEFGSYEEISFPQSFSPLSHSSDGLDTASNHRDCHQGDNRVHHHNHNHNHNHNHGHSHGHSHSHSHSQSRELVVSPTATVSPLQIKTAAPVSASTRRQSPSAGSGVGPTVSASSSSPVRRLSSGPRKSPIAKPTKAVVRRSSTGKDGKTVSEKKVGRRRGPLLPEQRKQASEIRKMRACLRCKFLKKTCDTGEPCAGCQPSHARLWQVPCTRIDIKDVGSFMKAWKADYEPHMDVGLSVLNIKSFSKKESLMWITHGYGFCLPISVREVQVIDDSCFQVDWVESCLADQDPIQFGIRTQRLSVGQEGISTDKLSEYLDRHIDGPFENFIDDHFEGTPFVTEILKTVHRFYKKQELPVIRKALKLVLAYNLTQHITMIEQQGSEAPLEGQIDDEDSKFYGKVVAPVMVNFQIKCAMANMWRDLQREILEELSSLYTSVYSGDRLKNWPTIFMLAVVLLVVWEEMQFDCHYRVPDANQVQKFCEEMEGIPVGVVVGLFHAISQKLPAFADWDTRSHGQVLNNNEAVCEALTDVRQHILKHETYLRGRQANTEFDRHDFDCLSNKFLSKLVIRAN